MRVLYAPGEVAGQAAVSSAALRELGIDARVAASPHPYGYDAPDIVLTGRRRQRLRVALDASRRFDVFHFFYGATFLAPRWRLIDAWALRRAGKRVVVEFCGSDVRMPSIEARRNPHYVAGDVEDDVRADALMRRWARITGGHMIVCDHQLDPFVARHFTHVHYVGQRIDTRRYAPRPPSPDTRVPVVVHAPSSPAMKGTAHVRRAIEELRAAGIALEYIEVQDVTHERALCLYERADIVVDQLLLGAHGGFAVEAMSLAKPVICNLLPEYAAHLPADCPIIEADPTTITAVLGRWLRMPQERHERGLASRAYVEREHDARIVVRRLLRAYEALPR